MFNELSLGRDADEMAMQTDRRSMAEQIADLLRSLLLTRIPKNLKKPFKEKNVSPDSPELL